ncbi:nuclear factor of activated T-cells 5-like isoform X3 [Symsagittifera roscoffensis]
MDSGVVTADDEQSSSNSVGNSNCAIVQNLNSLAQANLNERILFNPSSDSVPSNLLQPTQNVNITQLSAETAKLVSTQLSNFVHQQQQQQQHQQKQLQSVNSVVGNSVGGASGFVQQTGAGGPSSNIPHGAIMTNNVAMVSAVTSSETSSLHHQPSELDYRNSSHGGVSGGVPSYSNVTSPSAYTSPSEEDEHMDGSNDLISSDNEDISDINRSLLHSGNLERGPNGSYQNSGNATPGGGSGDYSGGGGGGGGGIQQVNMANGVGSELPTMVMKDDLDHSQPNQCNNDATTISSDSFSDSGLTNGVAGGAAGGGTGGAAVGQHPHHHHGNQLRHKRPFEHSSCPIAMYSRHTLVQQFPHNQEGVSLEVVNQPESRHRPRYLTEGSRGSVKDRTGNGYPAVKLSGFNQCPLTVQVFIGTDTGRPKPHGFFQACRVTGRNVISCLERNIDGTQIMEIDLDPKNDMRADIDCIGILKLRNSDVEAMVSTTRSRKKSQRARMVFRVCVPRADGSSFTLQTMSDTIQCSQPTGQPEIARLTVDRSPCCGGGVTYILGKHFTRPTVTFAHRTKPLIAISASAAPTFPGGGISSMTQGTGGPYNEGETTWSEVAELLPDCVSQHYLGCKIPSYREVSICQPVYCEVTVTNGDNKVSDPALFLYMPNEVLQEVSKLEAILSLPAAPLNQCPIMTIPPATMAPSGICPQSLLASTANAMPSHVMSSALSVSDTYGGGSQAKRSRTSPPDTDQMEESPGSGVGSGTVTSESANSKANPATPNNPNQPHSIMRDFGLQAYSAVQIQTLQLKTAVQQPLGMAINNVSSANYANQNVMAGGSSNKNVPAIVQSVDLDAKTRVHLMPQPPMFHIPQQMSLKSTPTQAGISQQMLPAVPFCGTGAITSMANSVFIKPESELVSCGARSVNSANGTTQPIVMPRGLITHVPPSQSVLPHPTNLSSVTNYKIQQQVFPTPCLGGNNGNTGISVNDLSPAGPNIQQMTQVHQQVQMTSSVPVITTGHFGQQGATGVPMDVSKVPSSSSVLNFQQIPPSDSPSSVSTVSTIGAVKTEESPSIQQLSMSSYSPAGSNGGAATDIDSILKGLLLLGANSTNPSTYAAFAVQISQQVQKDIMKTELSVMNSNPASVSSVQNTAAPLDATPPPPQSQQSGGNVNSNPSSVNQVNYNSPGSSQPANSNQQQQIQTQQQIQAVHATMSGNIIPVSQMSGVNIGGSQFSNPKMKLSQDALLAATAISKNPQLAPFAPQLISAIEAVQQQQMNESNADVAQLQDLLQQEAMKLASLAEQQQQQHHQGQNQQYSNVGNPPLQMQQNQPQIASQNSQQATIGQQYSSPEQIPQAVQHLHVQQQVVSSPPNQSYSQQQQQNINQQQANQTQHTYANVSMTPQQQQQVPPIVRQQSFTQTPVQTMHPPVMSQVSQHHNLNQGQSMNQQGQHQHQVSAMQQNVQGSMDMMKQGTVHNQQLSSSNAGVFYQFQTSGSTVTSTVSQQTQIQNQQYQPNIINQQQPSQNQQPQPQQQQAGYIGQQSSQQKQNTMQHHPQAAGISMSQQQPLYNSQPIQQGQPQQQFQQVYYNNQPEYQYQQKIEQHQVSQRESIPLLGPGSTDQPPPSVSSAPPPSVASGPPSIGGPSSVLSAPEINSPSSVNCGSQGLPNQVSSSMGNISVSQQNFSHQPTNSGQQQSVSSYVVYTQSQSIPQQHQVYYPMAQKEMHSSNMDLVDPDLYNPQTQLKSSSGAQTEIEEQMFKEPYPVDNSQNSDWQTQQQPRQTAGIGNVQYGNQMQQNVNDPQHQHQQNQHHQQQAMMPQNQQQMNMSWEPNSVISGTGSQSSMNWESSSGSNSIAGGTGGVATMQHHAAGLKNSTTDPFLSSGALDSNQVQKTSSLMDIHQVSTFEHDQNSQGSSISSNDFHDLDSIFSQIAQSPLCTILSSDSLLTPSPAPPMTPEEPPARGAAVLKYLIEKGFIEGEQRNLVTAEGIENAICSLSNQKPITEITFEDVVSVIAGTRNT